MRRRRVGGFERALRDARVFEDDDGNTAILLPAEHLNRMAAISPHAHAVPGGVLFAVDQDTLAEMVADTLAAIDAGGDRTETFRRRVAILRKLVGDARWAEAELVYEQARDLARTAKGPLQ